MAVPQPDRETDGNLAVVAVLLQKGADNQLVRELWNSVPAEKEKEEVHADIQIDMNVLLPSDKGYYTVSFRQACVTPASSGC